MNYGLNIETITLGVNILSLIVAFIKLKFSSNIWPRKSEEKLKKDYEFIKENIGNKKWKSMHNYLLEQFYFTIKRRKHEAAAIRFFLERPSPLLQLEDYSRGFNYLSEYYDKNNIKNIIYAKSVNTKLKLRYKIVKYFMLYILFGSLSLASVYYIILSNSFSLKAKILASSCSISFMIISIVALYENTCIEAAKRVIIRLDRSKEI